MASFGSFGLNFVGNVVVVDAAADVEEGDDKRNLYGAEAFLVDDKFVYSIEDEKKWLDSTLVVVASSRMEIRKMAMNSRSSFSTNSNLPTMACTGYT